MGRRVESKRSVDETHKIRRERNRQAQHESRKRRQAAERARQHRMKHLEDTIEKLSGIVVGICDDVLTSPEVVGQPGLIDRLQGSMREALSLAQSVVDCDHPQGLIAVSDMDGCTHRDGSTMDSESTGSRRQQSPSIPATQPTVDSSKTQSHTSTNVESGASTQNLPHTPYMDLPFGLRLPTQDMLVPVQDNTSKKPFPVQLVEATLSRACLTLSDPGTSPARLRRAFGSMIGRHCTREELLRRARWLLGAGYSQIYGTAGANWRPPSKSGMNGLWLGYSVFTGTDNHQYTEEKAQWTQLTQGEELLTALEVATQLESLGASFVGSDTIELRLAEDKNDGVSFEIDYTPTTRIELSPPGVRLRLSSFLLTTNLSSIAECVGFGPVYPRSQIAKAVEASVVFAWNG